MLVDKIIINYLKLITKEEYLNLKRKYLTEYLVDLSDEQLSLFNKLSGIFNELNEVSSENVVKYPIYKAFIFYSIGMEYKFKSIDNLKEKDIKEQLAILISYLYHHKYFTDELQSYYESLSISIKPKKIKRDKESITQKLDKYEARYKNIIARRKDLSEIIDSGGLEIKYDLDLLKLEMEQDDELYGILRYDNIIKEIKASLNELSQFNEFKRYEPREDTTSLSRSSTEHISLLVDRNLYIENVFKAKKDIEQRGFYRLTSYLKKLNRNNNYSNHTFNEVIEYYDMDVKLRSALFLLLEKVEVFFKYSFSNWLVDKYEKYSDDGIRCYRKASIFEDTYNFQRSISDVENMITFGVQDELPMCLKYAENHDEMPLWCICELQNLRWFISLFLNLNDYDKAEYVNEYYKDLDLQDFIGIICRINEFRNMCAHHNILYKQELKAMLSIKSTSDVDIRIKDNTVFAYVINIIRLIDDEEVLREYLHYMDRIVKDSDINRIKIAYGFLSNYKQILKEEMGRFLK